MRNLTLLLTAVTFGCRAALLDPPPVADISGTYTLVRLDGQALPVSRPVPDGQQTTTAGSIALNADSTFADVWVQEFQAAPSGLASISATSSCVVVSFDLLVTRCTLTKFGTWRVNVAGVVILTGEEFGATPYTQDVTRTGPTLTKLFGTWEWRYERQ